MKNTQMTEQLDKVAMKLWGRSLVKSLKIEACVTCGSDANHFRDELSRKEYSISGMCQHCQDGVFGK